MSLELGKKFYFIWGRNPLNSCPKICPLGAKLREAGHRAGHAGLMTGAAQKQQQQKKNRAARPAMGPAMMAGLAPDRPRP